jgi:hypothetical protein
MELCIQPCCVQMRQNHISLLLRIEEYGLTMILSQEQPVPMFIRSLMPEATEAELQRAADNFREYLAVVIRIYERLKREMHNSDSQNVDS